MAAREATRQLLVHIKANSLLVVVINTSTNPACTRSSECPVKVRPRSARTDAIDRELSWPILGGMWKDECTKDRWVDEMKHAFLASGWLRMVPGQ
jgi:hypothetical protein